MGNDYSLDHAYVGACVLVPAVTGPTGGRRGELWPPVRRSIRQPSAAGPARPPPRPRNRSSHQTSHVIHQLAEF